MKSPEIRIAEFILIDIDSKRIFVDKKLNPVSKRENREKLYNFFINKPSDYKIDFFVTIGQDGDCEFSDKKPEQACYHVLDLVVKGQYQGTRIDWFNE